MNNSAQLYRDLKKYLQFGMKLSAVVDLGGKDPYTFNCSFVGLREDGYLIFELSNKVMEEMVTKKVAGLSVVLRGVADTGQGDVIAFRSTIIGIKSIGSWLIFLEYPKDVETKPIRAAKRYKVHVDTDIELEGKKYKGELLDISVGGCAVYIEEDLNIAVNTEIKLMPKMVHLPNPHPKACVVNSRHQYNGTVLGVKLDKPIELSDQLRLEVLQQLVQEV